MRRFSITIAWSSLTASGLAGCPEEGKRRLGATCDADEECTSGLCSEGQCIDPSADDDGDSLTN